MRIVLNPTGISPHQLPLARAIAKRVGVDNFRYVCQDELEADRVRMGWSNDAPEPWVLRAGEGIDVRNEWLENADLLVSYIRNIDLFERRSKKGLRTFYSSERWFKPPIGMLRLLVPSFYKMTRRFVRLAKTDPNFRVLPIGVHARCDFKRMGVPEDKMTTWGYFVAPSNHQPSTSKLQPAAHKVRVLWVGRFLKLKNVDVIIRALQRLDQARFELTLVGDGPERRNVENLAQGMNNVFFKPSVKIEEVRDLMRTHDVYVFPSNGFDGWGAVVSEAMEEGMLVLGSNQAGAPATMLPPSHRFNCRDYKRLAALLLDAANGKLPRIPIGDWTAANAAERLLSL